MNKNQQDLRRSAAEKFIESFDEELLRAFQEPDTVTPTRKPSPEPTVRHHPPKKPESISLSDLEEAISDIEQYLQDQHHPEKDGSDG